MRQIGFKVDVEKKPIILKRQIKLASERYCKGWKQKIVRIHPYFDAISGKYIDGKILITINEI